MPTLLLLETAAPAVGGPDLSRYFAVCVGLIALAALAAWGFKRLFARSLASRAAKRSLQVLDLLPLGGKQRLAVVRCYERTFVVGLGDKELCLVAELDPQSLPEPAREALPTRADQGAFRRLLDAARPKEPRPAARPAAASLAREGVLG